MSWLTVDPRTRRATLDGTPLELTPREFDLGSSGLGLDIVRRAAERTGGSVELSRSALGGLRVVVDLLAPRQPAGSAAIGPFSASSWA